MRYTWAHTNQVHNDNINKFHRKASENRKCTAYTAQEHLQIVHFTSTNRYTENQNNELLMNEFEKRIFVKLVAQMKNERYRVMGGEGGGGA